MLWAIPLLLNNSGKQPRNSGVTAGITATEQRAAGNNSAAHQKQSCQRAGWNRDGVASIRAFGLDVVTDLCAGLLERGAPGLHFYTLNQAALTTTIVQRLCL